MLPSDRCCFKQGLRLASDAVLCCAVVGREDVGVSEGERV